MLYATKPLTLVALYPADFRTRAKESQSALWPGSANTTAAAVFAPFRM